MAVKRSIKKNINSTKKNGITKKKRQKKKKISQKKSHLNEKAVEGFTIIGEVESGAAKKVERVLPDWLANPSVITVNLQSNATDVSESDINLKPNLLSKLERHGIKRLFPVQAEVIPWLLHPANNGVHYWPKDLCVSAPTGSGKTLTYVLPIVNRLMARNVCAIRALVVLPVRDLAIQVYKVFQAYAADTPLKIGLLIGQKSFSVEQSQLVRKTPRGYISQVDILIATPGKLVDHMELTKGFCLHRLCYLVIDEADRMMEEINQDWLGNVDKKVQSTDFADCYLCEDDLTAHSALTVDSLGQNKRYIQKLLFSATLSQNPQKLQKLHLFQPKLFTSVVSNVEIKPTDEVISRQGEFIGKFTTPIELQEYFVQCDISLKPLVLFSLVQELNLKKVVCFTKSVENTRRLQLLMSSMGIKVSEISSNLRSERRERILKSFVTGKVNLLVCSDVMARGMDFDEVDHIVSYDLPPYLKTYIHRVGRTARAGRKGTSFVLLEQNEVGKFQEMISRAGKKQVEEWKVDLAEMKKYESIYKKALSTAAELIKTNQR